jgi:uncharacterized protein YggE
MKPSNNRILAIASVTLSALLILGAFTVIWLQPRSATPASAQSTDQTTSKPSQITVVGSGSISVAPDTVKLTVGYADQETTVADAQSKVDGVMAAITAKLTAANISDKDYRTVQYSVDPVMDYNNTAKGGNGTLSGFRVTNILEITLHDPSQAASLLDSLVSAGANTVYGVTFSVSNSGALTQQAYDQAMQDAKSRAQKIADLSNMTLGKIVSVSENSAATPIMYDTKSAGMGGGANIAPGQQTIQATLVVTYEANAK